MLNLIIKSASQAYLVTHIEIGYIRRWSYPINTKRNSAAVMRAPLDAGDNIPNIANAEIIIIYDNIIYHLYNKTDQLESCIKYFCTLPTLYSITIQFDMKMSKLETLWTLKE
jgi:hypothetical protein